MEYYILSLKHTSKADSALTLWRPDGNGYCWYKDWAGIYNEEYKEKLDAYKDALNIFIDKYAADKLMKQTTYDGENRMVLPNIPSVWQEFGLDYSKMKPKRNRSCFMSF